MTTPPFFGSGQQVPDREPPLPPRNVGGPPPKRVVVVSPERLEQEAAHVESSDVSAAGWLRAAARRIRELELLGDFKILRLQEGDRLALMCTPAVNAEQAARLRSQVAVWADVENADVAVFADGLEIQILRNEGV